MAVPTAITDLSTTAASNSPAGSDTVGTTMDDFIRSHAKFIADLWTNATIYADTVGGTADVITLTPTPAITAYTTGQRFAFTPSSTNTSTTTVNVNSLGAKNLFYNGAACAGGEIISGRPYIIEYDGTQFQTVSHASFVDSTPIVVGSADATKKVRFEVDGLTTSTTRTITVPDADITLVGSAAPTFTGATTFATTKIGAAVAQGLHSVSYDGTANQYLSTNETTGASSWTGALFQRSGVTIGSITHATSSTAYNVSSDYRLKENEEVIAGAIDRLNALKPIKFNWKAEPDGNKVDGFLAHEVAEVVPEAVHGEKDAVDADGKDVIQQVDQSKLVPLLVAAVQELSARVAELESR